MRRRVLLTTFGLLVAGASAAGVRAAQNPNEAEVPAAPAAPQLNAVKDVVKDAVKQAIPGGDTVSPPVAAPADPASAAAARITALRRKVLKDDDFVDNEESNRDPFRSYLRSFSEKATPRLQQVPAVFDKFALEELSLIAVVSGIPQPRAMFRDPSGLGQSIKRGDYLSKAAARVTKILSDRVILELTETTPTGEPRALEKAILVNPEGIPQ